jgi:3-deoxy-D-manno-octulosonic acid kinase
MSSIIEQFLPVPRGGIVYDAARMRKPDAAMFSRNYWAARNALEEVAGGRGSVSVLRALEGDWVLRHYRRGGYAAKISSDRYLWSGANATRSFREWRLLAQLQRLGLPVPPPVAARFERAGLLYRADIITVRLSNAVTLLQAVRAGAVTETMWQRIGKTIARFHAAGVHHADLNANNIMLVEDAVYLLDFDRGRIRARGTWEANVLARLKRSLDKAKTQHADVHFTTDDWRTLLEGLSGSERRTVVGGR